MPGYSKAMACLTCLVTVVMASLCRMLWLNILVLLSEQNKKVKSLHDSSRKCHVPHKTSISSLNGLCGHVVSTAVSKFEGREVM